MWFLSLTTIKMYICITLESIQSNKKGDFITSMEHGYAKYTEMYIYRRRIDFLLIYFKVPNRNP